MKHLWEFTPKEVEVADMICEGLGPLEIARRTGKTHETVRNQLRGLKAKTDTHTQLQLAVKLLKERYAHAA